MVCCFDRGVATARRWKVSSAHLLRTKWTFPPQLTSICSCSFNFMNISLAFVSMPLDLPEGCGALVEGFGWRCVCVCLYICMCMCVCVSWLAREGTRLG